MRLLFFILLNVFISCLLSAQGVEKSGQNTTTGINFVNKNGETELIPKFSEKNILKAINGTIYPYWSEEYLNLIK